MGIFRHILRLCIVMLFVAFGTNMPFAAPVVTSELIYLSAESRHLPQADDAGFTARAPPLAVVDIAITGGDRTTQGGAFALYEQEPVAALFGFGGDLGAPNSVVKPITVSTDVKTWNQFQSATKGQFVSRADAAKGWDLYKQANGIQTGTVRSQAAKSFFLKQLGASGKAPKWMNQYLANGKVPPGYHVDHLTPISVGGADSPVNMRLKDIATHVTRHKYYRPWE